MLKRMIFAAAFSMAAVSVQAARPQTVTLDVKGMTCPTCLLTVKVVLKKQPGVTDVKVDARRNAAEVTFDPEKVSIGRLAKAVTDAGYPAAPAR